MKKTGKLLSMILAGTMALSMAGCGSNTAETTAAATEAAKTEAAKTEAASESAAESTAEAAGAASDKTYKIGICQLVQQYLFYHYQQFCIQ